VKFPAFLNGPQPEITFETSLELYGSIVKKVDSCNSCNCCGSQDTRARFIERATDAMKKMKDEYQKPDISYLITVSQSAGDPP